MILKESLRQQMKSHLRQMTIEEKNQKSAAISFFLQEQLENNIGHWAAFKNLSSEPDLSKCDFYKSFYFPVLQESGNVTTMTFGQGAGFEKTRLGFEQPVDPQLISVHKLSGVLIPGLAFSLEGHRLGRGAGFYDRTLADYAGLKVGVCFAAQVIATDSTKQMPGWTEPHDVRMDAILTEQGWHWITG